MRILLPLLLSCAPGLQVLAAQDVQPPAPGPVSAAPASEDANGIAAEIIKQRALELASSNPGLAMQLENLAHGLKDGHISLADAGLVMAIANAGHAGAAPAAITPEAKASARQAEALLDGDAGGGAALHPAGAAAPGVPPSSAPAASADPAPAPGLAPTLPAPEPKVVSGKVYAVDDGVEGKVVTAAIGVGSNIAGLQVGSHFVIKRGKLTIAKATVFKLSPTLSYASIDQGSLVDPLSDVKEGDRAELQP